MMFTRPMPSMIKVNFDLFAAVERAFIHTFQATVKYIVNVSIILYADDILLLAPSICSLENLLLACETKLHELDLAINVKKSVCIRTGPRCRSPCVPLVMSDGSELCWLCWVESVRYLGVFIIRSYHFSCSFDNAKNLSTEVLMQSLVKLAGQHLRMHLIKSKCIPILL